MYDIKNLLKSISGTTDLINVGMDDEFDFTKKDEAFVIESGKLLAYDERNLTQTFDVYDPVGFAEAIAVRPKNLKFRKLSDLVLRKFDGIEIRAQANKAGVVANSIIKYSLGRIFESSASRRNYLFEDEFLDKNLKFLDRQTYLENKRIFKANDVGHAMYYIEKGSVRLMTENDRQIAKLNAGECFGEAALISSARRNCSVFTDQKSTFLTIDRDLLKSELDIESPLICITIVALLKRVELMNKLRWADDFSL